MDKSFLTVHFLKRVNSRHKVALSVVANVAVLGLINCSKQKSGRGASQNRVPDAPAIINSVAATALSASLDTQAEFASQFTTSLETVLGAKQSNSLPLTEETSAAVTEPASGAMSSAINLPNGLKELAQNHSDAGWTNSLTLLRDALPISKTIQKSKSTISKDSLLKNQNFLVVTENPLTDSQGTNLSFLLTPEFRVKSASSLSGSYISGSDGNTYSTSGQSDFDVDFSKFFQAVISSTMGTDSTASTETGSSQIRGSSKALFTVVKDTKSLNYIEQSAAALKITASGKSGLLPMY